MKDAYRNPALIVKNETVRKNATFSSSVPMAAVVALAVLGGIIVLLILFCVCKKCCSKQKKAAAKKGKDGKKDGLSKEKVSKFL